MIKRLLPFGFAVHSIRLKYQGVNEHLSCLLLAAEYLYALLLSVNMLQCPIYIDQYNIDLLPSSSRYRIHLFIISL